MLELRNKKTDRAQFVMFRRVVGSAIASWDPDIVKGVRRSPEYIYDTRGGNQYRSVRKVLDGVLPEGPRGGMRTTCSRMA